MAFVSSPIPQEEQNQFGPSGQTTSNPLALLPPQAAQTGGSAGQGGGAGASTAPGVGTPTQFGSTASRLSDYLQANKDQVQNMANNIAGNLGTQYSGVKGSIDQAVQTFGTQVQSGYTPTDPTLLNQVQTNPTEAAKNPDNVSSFQKQLNDTYRGPTSFEGSAPYAGVQEGVTNAVQQAGQLNTYPGLSTYLQGNVETNATPGQNTLDTVLLQGNQPAYKTVQDAAKPFAGLSDYLASLATTQDQSVQAAKAAAPAAQQAAQQALGAAGTNLSNQIQGEFGTAKQNATTSNADFNDIIARLSNVMPAGMNNGIQPLTAREQNELGINQDQLDQYANANQVLNYYGQAPGPINQVLNTLPAPTPMQLSSYLSGGSTFNVPQSPNDIATADEFATAKALSDLGGTQYQSPLDLSLAGQAGTAKPGGAYQTFDTSKANDLFSQVNARDQALANNYFASNKNLKPGDYQAALQQILNDPNAMQPGTGASYMLSAFNRLANGFNAPTPEAPPPVAPDPMHPLPGGFGFV